MDPIAIGGALSSFKTLTDIAQSFLQVRDTALIQGKVVELQAAIIGAQNETMAIQAAHAPLVARVKELEQEIVRLKDWEAEKQRYRLTEIDGLAFVYSHKPGMEAGEPAHWLCQKCFREGHPSTLQFFRSIELSGRMGLLSEWRCNSCGGPVMVKRGSTPRASEPDDPEPEARAILPD